MDLEEYYARQKMDKLNDDIWKDWQEAKRQKAIDEALERDAQQQRINQTYVETARDSFTKKFALLGLLVGCILAIIVVYINQKDSFGGGVKVGGGPMDELFLAFKLFGLASLFVGGGAIVGAILGAIIGKIKKL